MEQECNCQLVGGLFFLKDTIDSKSEVLIPKENISNLKTKIVMVSGGFAPPCLGPLGVQGSKIANKSKHI